jgi:hypothetical protein
LYPLLINGALGTVGVALAARLAVQLCPLNNWLALGTAAIAISAGYCVVAYLISLNRSDRQLLGSFIRRKSHV